MRHRTSVGTFSQTISIGDPRGEQWLEVDALVDTGASYTMVPGSLLQQLGVVPHTSRRFFLADGRAIERQMGRGWVRLDGQMEMTLLVFGDEGTAVLLGAYTLEALGLGVDPVDRRLVPVPGVLMAAAGRVA